MDKAQNSQIFTVYAESRCVCICCDYVPKGGMETAIVQYEEKVTQYCIRVTNHLPQSFSEIILVFPWAIGTSTQKRIGGVLDGKRRGSQGCTVLTAFGLVKEEKWKKKKTCLLHGCGPFAGINHIKRTGQPHVIFLVARGESSFKFLLA